MYTIGVDLGGTNLKTAIFDDQFEVVAEAFVPTEAYMGPDHVVHKMKETILDIVSAHQLSFSQIACIGMGIPGLLDPQEGLSIFSPNFPGWENIHVVKRMQSELNTPVFIDNDVRVNMYGEWRYGSGKGCDNLFFITLGTGLGAGVIIDGKVLYGRTSSAGEIGHMNMYREGRPCRCGSSGCLGRYVSAVGMVNTFLEKLADGRSSVIQGWVGTDTNLITAKMISDAYDLGDPLAIDVMHETGTLLGYGLSNVINLFNPEKIIVGGGMSAAGDRLLRTVRETTAKHALKLSNQLCSIQQATLGGRAGMLGAAIYAQDRWQGNGIN